MPPPASPAGVLAAVAVREEADGLRIGLGRCFATHLGLRLRRAEALGCLRGAFAGCSPAWDEAGQELVGWNAALMRTRLPAAAGALARIARRPLTPRLVAAALGISNQERLRWTKDGRLPSTGQAMVRRGQAIAVPTYAVSVVAALASQPEMLSEWRERDHAHRRGANVT